MKNTAGINEPVWDSRNSEEPLTADELRLKEAGGRSPCPVCNDPNCILWRDLRVKFLCDFMNKHHLSPDVTNTNGVSVALK